MAREHAHHHGEVLDVPRHDADRVEGRGQRHGAGAAHAPPGRLDRGDAAAGRRQAKRAARVGAEARGNGAKGNGRSRAGRRAARDPRGVPRISRMPGDVVVPRRPERELGEMQRGDLQRAGFLQAREHRRIVLGCVLGMDLRTPGGDLALAIEHVLVRERHAVERQLVLALFDFRVDGLGGLQRNVAFEAHEAVRHLVRGLEPVDGFLGRLDARDLLLPDGLGERTGRELFVILHDAHASETRTRRKSSTSALRGNSSATRWAVATSAAALASAAARRSSGMSR